MITVKPIIFSLKKEAGDSDMCLVSKKEMTDLIKFAEIAERIINANGDITSVELLMSIDPETIEKYLRYSGFFMVALSEHHHALYSTSYDDDFTISVPTTRRITAYPLSVKVAIKGLSDWTEKSQIEIIYKLLEMQQK